MNAVDARTVTKNFGQFTAVDTADIHVEPGEVVGLLGANGAGKTTLIRMILGLLEPTEGMICLFGEPPGIEQRRRIGYVPQNLGLYTDLTLAENLTFRSRVFSAAPAPAPMSTGMSTGVVVKEQVVGSLPLGLQRRGAFQAALQHRPDLLVLDEPTSGVSPLARSELWDIIRSEADRGVAVLASTHYMDEAVQTDRLVVMANGQVVATGSVADVIDDRRTFVVEADQWAEAFAALDNAGRQPRLDGRTIRIRDDCDTSTRSINEALKMSGVVADIRSDKATLEEVMVELST